MNLAIFMRVSYWQVLIFTLIISEYSFYLNFSCSFTEFLRIFRKLGFFLIWLSLSLKKSKIESIFVSIMNFDYIRARIFSLKNLRSLRGYRHSFSENFNASKHSSATISTQSPIYFSLISFCPFSHSDFLKTANLLIRKRTVPPNF